MYSFGEQLHYNGSTWKSFRDETGILNGVLVNIDIKGNTVVAVGYDNPKAKILVGTR